MAISSLISIKDAVSFRKDLEATGKKVALVPTMGALHQGHLSLMTKARSISDVVIATIFVNPKQFGPNEDFSKYPRTLEEDLKKLKSVDVQAIFLPLISEMYPEDFATFVHNRTQTDILCGFSRPGHFNGVLTVVLKLFNIFRPHYALFGKKDYQQLVLISRMVKDLNLPIQIMGCEIMREASGLALSSRNQYLSEEDKIIAAKIFESMQAVKKMRATINDAAQLELHFEELIKSEPAFAFEYGRVLRQHTLEVPRNEPEEPLILLIAVRLRNVRLIDNLEL